MSDRVKKDKIHSSVEMGSESPIVITFEQIPREG